MYLMCEIHASLNEELIKHPKLLSTVAYVVEGTAL